MSKTLEPDSLYKPCPADRVSVDRVLLAVCCRVDDIFRCFRFRAQELGRCGMGCLIRVAAACGMCSVVL